MPTAKQLDAMIKQQEDFVEQNQLVLSLMYAYRHDKDNLVFIGTKLKEKCEFDEKYLAECFDEIAEMAKNGLVGIASGGGIFEIIDLVPKKKRATMEELIHFIDTHEFKNI